MILESIVTSVGEHEDVNIAPMGPVVNESALRSERHELTFMLRPFNSSQTYRNLLATGKAVIHVTDDVDLFAKAAVDAIDKVAIDTLVRRIGNTDWWPLRDCHRWFAVEVVAVSDDEPRVEMECRVVHTDTVRPFFGFNRAKHAVIEAAILATRTHVLSAEEIHAEIERLRPLITKTGGPAETMAFEFLCKTIAARLARLPR